MAKMRLEDGTFFDPEVIESLIWQKADPVTGKYYVVDFLFTLNKPVHFGPSSSVKKLDVEVTSNVTEDKQLLQYLLQKTRLTKNSSI